MKTQTQLFSLSFFTNMLLSQHMLIRLNLKHQNGNLNRSLNHLLSFLGSSVSSLIHQIILLNLVMLFSKHMYNTERIKKGVAFFEPQLNVSDVFFLAQVLALLFRKYLTLHMTTKAIGLFQITSCLYNDIVEGVNLNENVRSYMVKHCSILTVFRNLSEHFKNEDKESLQNSWVYYMFSIFCHHGYVGQTQICKVGNQIMFLAPKIQVNRRFYTLCFGPLKLNISLSSASESLPISGKPLNIPSFPGSIPLWTLKQIPTMINKAVCPIHTFLPFYHNP